MKLHPGKAFLLVLAFFSGAIPTSALSPDPRLLRLVPPETQVVAGMRAPTRAGRQPDSFLLVTPSSKNDLQDFFALTGADSSRQIQQVIFVMVGNHADLGEHSLLVSGIFNPGPIMKAAKTHIAYRGVPIREVPPLERERDSFKDLRWLALLDSSVAIFGTVASVQQEIDRYLDNSRPDATLVERLDRLSAKDDTWCLVAAPLPDRDIQALLGMLDPDLAGLLRSGGGFGFGIRFEDRVQFEYEITAASNSFASAVSDSLNAQLIGLAPAAQSFLPRTSITVGEGTLHGFVKVSRQRYEDWLTNLTTRDRQIQSALR